MKMIVTKAFQDKFTKELYEVGNEIAISDDDRVKDLAERGLAKVTESEAPKKTVKKTAKNKEV